MSPWSTFRYAAFKVGERLPEDGGAFLDMVSASMGLSRDERKALAREVARHLLVEAFGEELTRQYFPEACDQE